MKRHRFSRTLSHATVLALIAALAPALAPALAQSAAPAKADAKEDAKPDTKPDAKADAKPDAKDDAKEDKDEGKSDDKSAGEKKDADKKDEEKKDTKEYRNWFDVSVGGVIVDGDKAAYQRRYGLPGTAFGGVEDFHYEEDIGKKGIFKVDGRGIFDNHDYSLKLDVEHPDIGYIRTGYSEFRSYYDGTGGFFRPTGSWITPFNDDMHVDRGNFFFEAGLTLPNKPNVSFRYEHQFTQGNEDSTSWGDLTIPGFGARSIIPSFLSLDDTRDIFSLDGKHTIGGTTFGAGVRYEMSTDDDSRNILRNPGEAAARYGTDSEKVTTDLFSVHAFSETKFNEKLLFTAGYAFTTLDSDISGYRVYGTTFDPVFANRLPAVDTFENLTGGSDLNQHVGNINLMWQLADSLFLIPSLRIESEDTDSHSFYSSPAVPMSGYPYSADSSRGILDVTERIDLRYTGVTNWVFYTRGEWLQGSGNLDQNWYNLGPGSTILNNSTDDRRFWQTYTVGANWYPLRQLNLGAEYFHKERSNDYDNTRDSTPNFLTSIPTSVYPDFLTAQSWTTDDANFRVTYRPTPKITLVGRYDFQFSTIDTKPDSTSGLSQIQTSEMTSHIVGGSISWTPLQRLFLQGSVNVVWDQTETPASNYTYAVQDALNNYWTANASLGYALDDKTDLQLQGLYYHANDLQNNYAFGMPYGADAQEWGITAGIVRRITERMRVTLKYGYYDGSDYASGEHNNYQAHLIYTSLHYKF